jgi:hypothetical protein
MAAPKGNDFAVGNNGGAPKGNQNAVGNSGGAPPEKNQNAQTVGLWAKHEGYYHNLPNDEKEWVDTFLRGLLEQYQEVHDKEPASSDHELLKNIAIDIHRVAHANEWFAENALVHEQKRRGDGWTSVETKINVWASEIRQYNESIYRRLDKHGLLESPEKQAANARKNMSSESYTIRLEPDSGDKETASTDYSVGATDGLTEVPTERR